MHKTLLNQLSISILLLWIKHSLFWKSLISKGFKLFWELENHLAGIYILPDIRIKYQLQFTSSPFLGTFTQFRFWTIMWQLFIGFCHWKVSWGKIPTCRPAISTFNHCLSLTERKKNFSRFRGESDFIGHFFWFACCQINGKIKSQEVQGKGAD